MIPPLDGYPSALDTKAFRAIPLKYRGAWEGALRRGQVAARLRARGGDRAADPSEASPAAGARASAERVCSRSEAPRRLLVGGGRILHCILAKNP